MKFKYRLAPLLKIRESVRAEKQAELNKALEAARIIEDELSRIKNELAQSTERGREALRQPQISVDYLLSVRRHELYLLTQQADVSTQLGQVQQVIEQRRQALMEADREVKVLEKLRDKLKEKHLQEEAKADMKQMDEIAGRQKDRGFNAQ